MIRAVIVAVVIAATVSGTALGPIGADDSLDSIRESRREAQAAKAASASQVNAVTAEIGELTEALDILEVNVSAQEVALASAERLLEQTERELGRAEEAVEELEIEVATAREDLADQAIRSFVGRGTTPTGLLEGSQDPIDLVRIKSIAAFTTGSDVEAIEQFRNLDEDLAIQRANAEAAAAEAERLRTETAQRLTDLTVARDEQRQLTADAELRLDRLLAEVAQLESRDADLARQESEAIASLAAQLARRPASGSSASIPIPPASEITIVSGYAVHQSIAANVELMIDHASREGIELGGWGWRDSSTQVDLRRSHCGTSDYAVYDMPSYECSPPTARPGASMHERGLALDITYNGRAIAHQQSPAFIWLNTNAAAYGFYNLPSEPWHWSTTGS